MQKSAVTSKFTAIRALIAARDSTRFQPEERAFEFCAPFAHEIVISCIRMISRSPRDNWDAYGVIRDQHRTRTYNCVRDRATYRVRAALIIV